MYKNGATINDVISGLKTMGIEARHDNLTLPRLKSLIEEKKPAICVINCAFLPWIHVHALHSVVVIGYEHDDIILIDPLTGEKKINAFDFMNGWKIFNKLSLIID